MKQVLLAAVCLGTIRQLDYDVRGSDPPRTTNKPVLSRYCRYRQALTNRPVTAEVRVAANNRVTSFRLVLIKCIFSRAWVNVTSQHPGVPGIVLSSHGGQLQLRNQ